MASMRAAVTRSRRLMEVAAVPEPREPGPGEVLVRPEAVGLCGSDFHYYLGDIGTIDDPSTLFPRVQGHEASATVLAAGPGCATSLAPGTRVALWPVVGCGDCAACRIGRPNACVRISLIGIHRDGALQERLLVPATQALPVGDLAPSLAALVEPVSIAVRAVARARLAAGERAVVLGAGPIGQALALASLDRGAAVLLVDTLPSRLALGAAVGADVLEARAGVDVVAAAREWAGDDGPDVAFEATGAPALVQRALDVVAHAGRVVVVGLSGEPTPLRVGDLPLKEVDLLGTSCCAAEDFAAAAELVSRRRDAVARLVTHEFPLAEAPAAIEYAMEHPAEVLKAVVRLDR